MKRILLMAAGFWFGAWSAVSLAADPPGGKFAIIVASAAGEPEFKEKFWDWSSRMHGVLQNELGFDRDQIFLLFEDQGQGETVSGRSTLKELSAVLDGVKARKPDLLFVFLLGHASFDGAQYKFNLVGPDLTGGELRQRLVDIAPRQTVLVVGTPASGILTKTLSAKGTVILTATKSESENNQVVFPGFFVEAFEKRAADADKNGAVSMVEAYLYSRQKVEAWYKENGHLATEHALLEDNADGKGSPVPSPENGDGLLAQKITLGGTPAASQAERVGGLADRKKQLEDEIADLKYRKNSLSQQEYQAELEKLLLELAETNRRLRASGGR